MPQPGSDDVDGAIHEGEPPSLPDIQRADGESVPSIARGPGTGMRWSTVLVGCLFVVLWLACWATSVVPGSPAMDMQWAGGNALAFLAGGAFGAAIFMGRKN